MKTAQGLLNGTGHVSAYVLNGIGHIVLNRPQAHNALDTAMVKRIQEVLDAWDLERVDAVVIRSTNPRVFSAGGDIKRIQLHAVNGATNLVKEFFSTEYRMNATIAGYARPVISLISGVCFGGGLGLAVHGRFRIITKEARLSMPETAIGFFPDVGASYFLPRLPGALGMYLGITGHQLDYRDALYTGLATHCISAENMAALPEMLVERRGTPIATLLSEMDEAERENYGHLADHRAEIDWCFSGPTLGEMKKRLATVNNSWSKSVLDRIHSLSPQSLELTIPLLRWGGQRSLDECLRMELRLSRIVTRSEDFIEGVRAALIDKDRRPAWAKNTEESMRPLFAAIQE